MELRWRAVCVLPVVALAIATALGGCAGQECNFHSECGSRRYCSFGRCLRECLADFDCEAGQVCNEIGQCASAADAGMDASVSAPDSGARDSGLRDSGVRDAGVEDAGTPRDVGPPDTGPPRLGIYLDRCATDADCASGRCVDDVGGTRMCAIACSTHSDCASEHVCASGVCRRDDTGAVCTTAAGCVLGLCAGNIATGAGECSRPCASASDCPAGYACTEASGVFLCVNIERSCAQCPTGQCLGAQGCTSSCRTAADCPLTLPGLSYSCSSSLCLPSDYVFGSDPIGAPCRMSGGANLCRSGTTIDDPAGCMCTQRCAEGGGCGPGFGCVPVDDGMGGVLLVCLRAGSNGLGSSCARDAECASGICDASGVCTRLCTMDGRCPSALRCRPLPGLGVSTCQP